MAENSGIEWTTHTFNPWIGCTKVSAACDHCYAEAWDKRFNGERWGPHADRTRTKTWGNPIKWNRQAAQDGTRPRVFCASLADVFDNHRSIQDAWRRELWALIRQTPNLDWLLLTKRPQNIARYLPDDWRDGYPNVWLGVTVENQTEADRRIPHLLAVPAAVRFLSCEPLQGPVDIESYLPGPRVGGKPCLHWIIAGGENGPHYRPADPDWFRSLRDQCADAGVPFLFKQWEGRNQREIKAKGRELDGVVHDGYPVISANAGWLIRDA
jgi:protein gp37